MSDELEDEVEAINSIYGDGSLVPADDAPSNGGDSSLAIYILNLPGGASSLRLGFPASYPAQPPKVLATNHSSGGKKGAGARDLGLFRQVLGRVYMEGVVCLFDAVEEFGRAYKEACEAEEETEREKKEQEERENSSIAHGEKKHGDGLEEETVVDVANLPTPPWTLSAPIIDSKSTFIAHIAPVTSTSQASLYLRHLVASDKRIRTATHNITAWRIRGAGGTSFQDCDDDGETAAGGRLLHLMQVMEIWDAMVVVTRWYGGVKLGPRRFAVINQVARDGFVRAGLVPEEKKEKEKSEKKKK